MKHDKQHEQEVVGALKDFSNRIEEIMNLIGDKKSLANSEREEIHELLVSLKKDLNAAAKSGKVRNDKNPQSEIESAFFDPAVSSASANFTMKTNCDPLNPALFNCLYGLKEDIDYYLNQLTER